MFAFYRSIDLKNLIMIDSLESEGLKMAIQLVILECLKKQLTITNLQT
jgi:hypothetical protein